MLLLFSELIARTESVIDCAIDFTFLLIIIQIDDWIGEYFLLTRDDIKELLEIILLKFGVLIKIILDISIVAKIEDFCCLMGFFIVLILIYESLSF